MKIQVAVMEPLTDLMNANEDYYNIRQIIKKSGLEGVPEFRMKALEAEFVKHLTRVCEIVRDFGKPENQLKEWFDIQKMLNTLKIPDWENIPPLKFYLQPLSDAFDELVDILRDMRKSGFLHVRYVVENNEAMVEAIKKMVHLDVTAQWLMGTDLKVDQFKFCYDIHKIVYESPLKDIYLNDKENEQVFNLVIPNLTAFKQMLHIKQVNM